jgi:hypothetical protein
MAGFGTKTSRAAAALGAYVDEKFDNAIAMAESMAAAEENESATRATETDNYNRQVQQWQDQDEATRGARPERPTGVGSGDPDSGEFTQLYQLQAEFGKATAANQVSNGIIKGINEDQKDASRVK